MAERHGDGWHLTHQEYARLVEDSKFLDRLYAAGVDNWEGYPHACSSSEEDED
jgi:hypothetical protein